MTLTDTQARKGIAFRDMSASAFPPKAHGGSASISVSWLSGGDLDTILPAWRALADNACEPNPFFEAHMLRPALEHLKGGRQVQVLAVFDAADPTFLIGLMPVRIRSTYRGIPLKTAEPWKHIHGFLATPLLRKGHEDAALHGIIGALKARKVKLIRFHHAAADGAFARTLDAIIAHERLAARTTRSFERAILASSLDGDAYLANSISKKKRKEFGRLGRRLADEGVVEFETADLTDAAAVEGVALEFMELERSGWKGRRGTAMAQRPQEMRFFLNACRMAAARGNLYPLTLRVDGAPVASIVNFAGGGADGTGLFSFKIAYDESFARHSPGVLLELELTARALSMPCMAFTDSCANPDHPMIDHLWRERRAMRDINVATGPAVPSALIRLTAALEHGIAAFKARTYRYRADLGTWLNRRSS